jgi:hypothetical protein
LHDTDFRRLFHLRAGIQKAIRRDTSIGVN